MRPGSSHRLFARVVAVFLTAAAVASAPLSTLAASAGCTACKACEAGPAAAVVEPHDADCCAPVASEAQVLKGPASQDASPAGHDCCPPGCARCCVTQARATAPVSESVTVQPGAVVWISHPALSPAPPTSGVHDSIFHPPRR